MQTDNTCKQKLILHTNNIVEDLENNFYYQKQRSFFELFFSSEYIIGNMKLAIPSISVFISILSGLFSNIRFTTLDSNLCKLASIGLISTKHSDINRIINLKECISIPINDLYQDFVKEFKVVLNKLQASKFLDNEQDCLNITYEIKKFLIQKDIYNRYTNSFWQIMQPIHSAIIYMSNGYWLNRRIKKTERLASISSKKDTIFLYGALFTANIYLRSFSKFIDSLMTYYTSFEVSRLSLEVSHITHLYESKLNEKLGNNNCFINSTCNNSMSFGLKL